MTVTMGAPYALRKAPVCAVTNVGNLPCDSFAIPGKPLPGNVCFGVFSEFPLAALTVVPRKRAAAHRRLPDLHRRLIALVRAKCSTPLDRDVGLWGTQNRLEKAEARRFPLRFATGSVAHLVRKDAYTESISGRRPQFGQWRLV